MKRTRDLLLCCLLLACCQSTVSERRTMLLMDTYVTIHALGPRSVTHRAVELGFKRLAEIDRRFNHLDSTSPVFAFNTRNVPLEDPEVISVLEVARDLSIASGGVFDVTVEPLVRLWGFYDHKMAVPPQRAIDSCLKLVGYQYLVFEPGRVTKVNPNTTIDLGGIAKGYALKQAARVLREAGIDSAVIDAGGDIFAIGRNRERNWKVGICNPRGEGIIDIVSVSNMAVVTSGDYERFFFGPPDSTRYCHIIDPRTGWPGAGIASATVVTCDPLGAQGWSKVLLLLGPEAIPLAVVNGCEALLLTDSLQRFTSPGLDRLLQPRDQTPNN